MQGKSMKVDKYGSLIISTPKLKYGAPDHEESKKVSFSFEYPLDEELSCDKNKLKRSKSSYVMRDLFFACKCKKNKDGTKTLILSGKDLYSKIGRRFQNWDTPYLINFLSKYENVTRLILPYNNISSAGFISLIDYIIEHDYIVELDVRYNEIGRPGINYMYYNAKKMNLQVLQLSGNKIGVQDAKRIAIMLTWNTSLRKLYIAETDQSEANIVYFATVLRPDQEHFNETLKTLDLSRPNTECRYMKFDSSHVATVLGLMLRYNKSLEELHLQKFDFICHDIEDMLQNAKYNRTLKLLDLSCNNIGDHGAEILSNWLKERPALRCLLLAHNIISNHGVSWLSRGIPFSKLLVLDLSYNRFDDESAVELLHFLKKSPLIQVLKLYGNDIGHPTAKIIERMLLSKVLDQEKIDVKIYEVDGKFYFAYYEGNGQR